MPDVTPLRPGDPRRIGRYRLTGRLDGFSRGDTARQDVFQAQRVDGAVVMAVFPGAGRAADAAARDRFVAEARVARNIPPFCVARILDAGVEGSQPYLITEFVPGPSLAEVVAAEGPLPGPQVRALAVGCATGIASIHQAGLVHGQFGPDLVLLGRDGPRVVHFSTTPPYGAATPAADILAWARVVAYAASGHRPGARDLAALPADLRPVVAVCLSPDPVARPHARALLTELLTGADLSGGLLAAGAHRSREAARAPALLAPVSGEEPQPRRGRSRAAAWAVGFLACIAAIVAAVVFITGRHPGNAPAARAPGTTADGRAVAAGLPIPRRLGGTWSGTIHQRNPALSVAVRLTLPAGRRQGALLYPQIGCTGSLALASSGRSVFTFRLAITSGRSNCVGGRVKLAVHAPDRMTFTFLRPGGGNPVGTLTRQR